MEQKSHEEFLRQREQQLAQWEQDVFERELSLLILHLNQNQNQEKPNVKKRKGTFKKHKLKCKNGEKISMPQGKRVSLCAFVCLSSSCFLSFSVTNTPTSRLVSAYGPDKKFHFKGH